MEDIIEVLDISDGNETDFSTQLRNQASQLLDSTTPASLSSDPSTLHNLLTQIIKPVFAKSQHQAITSTGRKNRVSTIPLASHFGTDSIFEPPPPWKASWTVPLLSWLIRQYKQITDPETRKKAVEADFHLLVPPLLHLIDDHEISFKAQGCEGLAILCDVLSDVQSDILKRTGLAEVFLDALKGCFHYLPSLTPEEESLTLMVVVYPAYMAIVRARYTVVETCVRRTGHEKSSSDGTTNDDDTGSATPPSMPAGHQQRTKQTQQQLPLTPTQVSTEVTSRNTHLSTLLRHSLLYSIAHLRTSSDAGTTTSVPITTFLLAQIPHILPQMDIYAAAHLQSLAPMLVNTLRDPFVTVAPEMMGAAVEALEGVVVCCWVRVRERWWRELLRGCVAGWLNVRDEVEAAGTMDASRREGLEEVVVKIERLVGLLEDVVGEEFENVVDSLVEEEPELQGMCKGHGKR